MSRHPQQVTGIRLFGMSDPVEQADTVTAALGIPQQMAPIIYPHSLLYLISGALEKEPDTPVLGMQRFFNSPAFTADHFPLVVWARDFFSHVPHDTVW